MNVRLGSLAALHRDISRMSASEGKADVFRFKFGSLRLNVRFSPKRTFQMAKFSVFRGRFRPAADILVHAAEELVAL